MAEGKIYREMPKAAKTIPADLIVGGSHHPGLKLSTRPDAAKVMRHADCSVLVVRD